LIGHPEPSFCEGVRISSSNYFIFFFLPLAKGRGFFNGLPTTKVHQFLIILFESRFTIHDFEYEIATSSNGWTLSND
jgi:hypothetical protein